VKHVFLSGDPALDFAATLRSRRGVPFEMFTSPESLDSWFRESGVVDGDMDCRPSDVEEAVAVREAIYSLVIAKVANAGRRTEATPAQALSSVARHAIEILSGPEVPLLKECANPECTRVYVDRSRGMRREWCGMDPCGNKMKAAAYRARKRGDHTASRANRRPRAGTPTASGSPGTC
jgi:predicted RNA-binding Zn ribbon-like protein